MYQIDRNSWHFKIVDNYVRNDSAYGVLPGNLCRYWGIVISELLAFSFNSTLILGILTLATMGVAAKIQLGSVAFASGYLGALMILSVVVVGVFLTAATLTGLLFSLANLLAFIGRFIGGVLDRMNSSKPKVYAVRQPSILVQLWHDFRDKHCSMIEYK